MSRLKEECGVFGIFDNKDAAALTALGLHALQHRGQEGCGIVTTDKKKFYAESEIIIYGRSIGSGFSASLAASNHPKKLILDSPYFSMYHLVKMYLPFLPVASILNYHIRTYQHIQNVKCPIFIIHGTDDKLIPYRHALKLSQLNKRSHLTRIKGGGHNNLTEYSTYHHHVYDILNDTFDEPSFFEELF